MSHGEEDSSANKTGALAQLLNKLDLPTLLMVMVFGGGNLFVTQKDGHLTREEAHRVATEVHELHSELRQWEERQKAGLDNQRQILANQQQILRELGKHP